MSPQSTGVRPPASYLGQHAVVIGASMAGLMAAELLSRHFSSVSVIERDPLADSAEPRKGVPQGKQVHGLLHRGYLILERLLPGFSSELVARGAHQIDMSKDLAWHHRRKWKLRVDSGVLLHTMTRPLLEHTVRRRVQANQRVKIEAGYQVLELASDLGRKRVTGVRLQPAGGERKQEQLDADLVVDASGRGSLTPQWLEKLGYARPDETLIKMNLSYSTRIFRRPPRPDRPWKALMLYPTPPQGTRMGIMFPVEGDRWIATIIGWVGDHPPADEAGYMDFARNMEAPDFFEEIRDAEPLSPVMVHRFPSNQRRHYERLSRFPGGLVVLGDALCSFNPSYGQGMTTTALGIEYLERCFEEGRSERLDPDQIAARFRRGSGRVLSAPWLMAANEDLSWPQTEGRRAFHTDWANAYLRIVHELTETDSRTLVTFLRAMHMLAPPSTLFSPRVLSRVARYALSRS